MLALQSLNQLVFNLSQVASALSSSYVRITSTKSKRKPEVDVLCSESFINSLEIFQKSENGKIFNHLPAVKFGPKFEDIQWIHCNDISYKFKAGKSVKGTDFYLTLNERDVRNFIQSTTNSLRHDRKFGKEQKKILNNQEAQLNKWNESFISKSSFDENKNSPCGSYKPIQVNKTSLLCNTLLGSVSSYTNSPSFISIQKRGFKTRRLIELEEKSNPGLMTKLGRIVGAHSTGGANTIDPKEKSLENSTVAKLMAEETHPENKLKLKVSFAEGYMSAASHFKKEPETFLLKLLNVAKILMIVTLLSYVFVLFNGKRRLFPFNFGHHGEVDPEDISVTFSDVKGVEEVKEELNEIVEFLRNPEKFSSMGGKLPKGVLLVGPPGTGKTLLARAVAGEANVPFFHASGSEFDEIFVGEGARRVRNLFRSAKAKAPSIIFIDEIDCVGSKRRSTVLHPYANQTINQLLSEMDGFSKNEGVIIIGATNRKEDLDSALMRPGRFDVEVLVPLPDIDGRKEILELYLSKILGKDIDISKLAKATPGCTGADLEAIVNHAAIRAAAEGASYVTMEYLENAKDKIMIGPERKSAMKNSESNMLTAYHEGGHTVVAYFTEGVGVVDKVTIVPRGQSLGHTAVVPETDDNYVTRAMCMARMDILLGGRAAEELVFGVNKITANASDDLDKATTIASNMVKKFGMSEKVGLRTLKNSEGEFVSVNQYGQVVTDQVDLEVKRLIQESYERAKAVLKKHAKEHKLLADALIKYKTLSPEDVRAILGENSSDRSSASSAAAAN